MDHPTTLIDCSAPGTARIFWVFSGASFARRPGSIHLPPNSPGYRAAALAVTPSIAASNRSSSAALNNPSGPVGAMSVKGDS